MLGVISNIHIGGPSEFLGPTPSLPAKCSENLKDITQKRNLSENEEILARMGGIFAEIVYFFKFCGPLRELRVNVLADTIQMPT